MKSSYTIPALEARVQYERSARLVLLAPATTLRVLDMFDQALRDALMNHGAGRHVIRVTVDVEVVDS